jgi:tRNA threonylcarbamoyladenosine biosynthesis protein TsaE
MRWQGSETGLSAPARELLALLKERERTRAHIVGLSGELGAGKTTFVKALAGELGVPEAVRSPTFVIEKIYKLPEGGPCAHLIHIDAYRLGGGSELAALGFAQLLEDPDNLIVIEWPEHVEDVLPNDWMKLTFEVVDECTRKIMLENDKIQNPNDTSSTKATP